MLHPGVVLAHQPFPIGFDAPAFEALRTFHAEVGSFQHLGEECGVHVLFGVDEGVFQLFLLVNGSRHGFDGP